MPLDMTIQEFREDWIAKHPASVPQWKAIKPKYARWFQVSVNAMFICSALMSGVHTVPTVRAGIEVNEIITPLVRDSVSLLSFVAVELAILISAYMRSMNRILSTGVLIVAFSIAVIANITSVQRALAASDGGVVLVSLIMGVGAPLLALLAGAAMLVIDTENRADMETKTAAYQQALVVMDNRINAAWTKANELEKPSTPSLPAPTQGEFHEISRNLGEKESSPKPRVKVHVIAKQVRENHDENLSVAEMMLKYNIAQGSTTKVRELLERWAIEEQQVAAKNGTSGESS